MVSGVLFGCNALVSLFFWYLSFLSYPFFLVNVDSMRKMGSRFSVGLNAWSVLFLAWGVHGQTNVAAPTNENFVRRGFQSCKIRAMASIRHANSSAIVLGDYLYITGGELAQTVDGELSIYPRMSDSMCPYRSRHITNIALENNTLSIDLRYSWINNSVSLNVITQDAPPLNSGVLWASKDKSSLHAWGGEQSTLSNDSLIPVATNDLWRFDVNGQGGGTWQSSSVPSNFVRTSGSQYTSGGDVGYILGGYVSDRTSPDNQLLRAWPMSPGMVSYDMTTGAWLNESSCVGDSCYRDNGFMQFVDGFGSSGVIVALGGCTQTTPTYFGQCNATAPDALSNIYIYDPAQNNWFTQKASNVPGQLPAPRQDFCGVGVPGDNGTYEIFIFGGGLYSDSTDEDLTHLDEVFVLSLPSFTWFKADYTPVNARTAHSCNVIGRRQMISLGGVNPAGNIWLPADPWTQSIGVFDMTEMRWIDGYNASAEDYKTPEVVRAWYADQGQYPNWDSEDVKALFFNKLTSKSPACASSRLQI